MTQAHGLVGGRRIAVSVCLALGTFMQVLDTTIANVSIPTIAGNLGASADEGTWIITSFAVANGICVPLTGWLMRRYGAVRTFVVALLLFTLASIACGLAWSMPSLVFFRVVQGAASGPLIPGSQALLVSIFPVAQRGYALTVWSITALLGPVTGPLLGGWICDNASWPWIFLINVPVGLFAAFVTWTALSKHQEPGHKVPIDVVGFALLVIGFGSMQLVLDRGKDLDWFHSHMIVLFSIAALVGTVLWIIWETTEEHPIVDLSLFKNFNFTIGVIVLTVGYALYFGNIVLLPLWLQTQVGYTATWAGIVAAPAGALAVVLSLPVNKLVAKFDNRLIATASLGIMGLTYFMRSWLHGSADLWSYCLPNFIQGIGTAGFFVPLINISYVGLEPRQIPMAAGLTNFIRITGGSFAASLTTTFWDRREAFHQTNLVSRISAGSPQLDGALQRLHALGMNGTEAMASVGQSLTAQAYALSSLDFFWLTGWISMILLPFIWFSTPPRSGSGQAPVVAD